MMTDISEQQILNMSFEQLRETVRSLLSASKPAAIDGQEAVARATSPKEEK